MVCLEEKCLASDLCSLLVAVAVAAVAVVVAGFFL